MTSNASRIEYSDKYADEENEYRFEKILILFGRFLTDLDSLHINNNIFLRVTSGM